MVYERLGIKKVWDGKKEYCSEKKEGKSGRYTEILQIFHMTVMILGIFMEKISRVQAMGGKRAGIFAAYAAAGKGSWICRNKVRYIVNKNGSGHAVAAVAGGNNGMGRRAGESGFYPRQARSPGKRTAGNKYRDRRLLIDFPEISTVPEVQKKMAVMRIGAATKIKLFMGQKKDDTGSGIIRILCNQKEICTKYLNQIK